MNQAHKVSITALLALILLLPIFFLPGSILALGVSKSVLVAVAAIVAFIGFALSALRAGAIDLPRHYILWATVALPAVYIASALLSGSRDISLFGYGLEVGTAAYIMLASALFGITAIVFNDSLKIGRALSMLFISLSLVALFAVVKLLTGGSFPVWGTFQGMIGNPVGSWADYAVVFGFLSTLSVLAIGTLTLERAMKIFMYVVFAISTILMCVLNFSTAFIFALIAAVVVLVYLLTVEKKLTGGRVTTWPAIALAVISLVFIINPVVSATRGTIGETLSGSFGINNADVRPSLSSTLAVGGAVIKSDPVLGAGPNTFNQSWLMHKPQEVNQSIFWNTAFPAGFGFLPTQVSTVGILGSIVWLLFFVFFILLGVRSLVRMPEDRWQRFMLVSTFFGSLFLWVASFMYTPSSVVLTLAFILTGLFVAASRVSGAIMARPLSITRNIVVNFVSVLVLVGLGIGAVALGFSVYQKASAASHFQRALVLSGREGSSVTAIQDELVKALRLAPADAYYGALSELNIARAQAALNSTEGTQEENLATFQEALSNGIAAAQAATTANPGSYRNWVVLGSIYSSLVPAPFQVEGAYESAVSAYTEAKARNPRSPEVPVLLARLELERGNVAQARAHIEESLALKNDYADAYFLLTQLEIRDNNIEGAIRSAETSAILSPDNAGIFFQLGLLLYSNQNFEEAVAVFNRALQILPEYANAKYFLGLSLAELGQTQEAITQFENLAVSHPDNAEVQQILANLREGREALFGFPQETTEVESRETPPITGEEN